ncbi:hypothetical protein F5883DRAFT_649721 [Diaporthe sp. PMI_573]|nr:hypothetical protein F5883DRAFT_649721 [Diaporthaceae sp. PMI_573]
MRALDITIFKLRLDSHEFFQAEGYLDKIRGACATTREQGLRWVWIDSCCINKSSATEEAESINSMPGLPGYYHQGGIADQDMEKKAQSSSELLAPCNIQFYNTHWNFIGTKTSLVTQISRITGINTDYLTGARHFRKAYIATKISWAAGHTTTRVEDTAYSLLGFFNITITPQYGKGPRAFMRLQQKLLATTEDESLFA